MDKLIPPLLFLVFFSGTALAQNNPVILELFTSQGCSSCPAADKNLTEILEKANVDGKPIYGLSFHVDYWNYIGWKDPYSSREFTARQRSYGTGLHLESIYTPQMIVNGRDEFVGSDRRTAELTIKKAQEEKSEFSIAIENIDIINGILRFEYSLDKSPGDEVINFAIVERNVENYVSKGENTGKKLHHDNVVRVFVTKPALKSQKVELQIPISSSGKMSLIVYVQGKNMHIMGTFSTAI